MTIDPINQSNDVSRASRNASIKKTGNAQQKDSVNISQNAKELAETRKFVNIIQNAPDIRVDKVEQAKKNLEAYLKDGKIDSAVLEKISERIAQII